MPPARPKGCHPEHLYAGSGGNCWIDRQLPPARQPGRLPHNYGSNVEASLWGTRLACREGGRCMSSGAEATRATVRQVGPLILKIETGLGWWRRRFLEPNVARFGELPEDQKRVELG